MNTLFSEVTAKGNTITYRFGKVLRDTGLVRGDLHLEYNVALGNLPHHILYIPGLLNFAPVIWYSGIRVSVPFSDEALEKGLKAIRDYFRSAYPEGKWLGEIVFSGPQSPPQPDISKVACLFSGGLDSVMSVTRHTDEGLVLITVGGADMSSDDPAWPDVQRNNTEMAKAFGCEIAFVNGNIKECLNTIHLSNTPFLRKYAISWWAGVQHGLALAGLVAPIAWKRGIGKLYIASSYTEAFSIPWGSGPFIDNNTKWSGFEVQHDGFEMSRQEKYPHIIDFCQRRSVPRPHLRVCVNALHDSASNCGRCEKCLRTMAGVMAEGEDPRDWGFADTPDEAAARINASFTSRKITMKDDEQFMWRDVKKRAMSHSKANPTLKTWLERFDIDSYRSKSNLKVRFTRPIKTALSKMPFLYAFAKRAVLLSRR